MKFKHKKSLGQNFLKDKNIINKIINSFDATEKDLIIEIGPGQGALTKELIKKDTNILCFEIDNRLKEELDNIKQSNLEIIYEDFLKVDLKKYINKYNPKNLYFISNLPYYITTPIINKIISDKIDLSEAIFMVQKEVAGRFTAKINTREYNSLTLFLNYYFNISLVCNVSKNCFIPKPKVDSVVLKFTKKTNKYNVKNEEQLFKLIRHSFRYKRKNLKNNLNEYNLDKINEVLRKRNKDLTLRAEALTLEDFIEISNKLN